ncbi:unknown [Firmicutes bacterium CAG:194]|nr:unknown [Firmicutes bacterium CAG:194]
MKLSNQLFRNYSELADIILHCYKDLVILDFYRTLQIGDKEKYCKSININNHFVVLLQKDLALSLWKICFDNDPKANTVSKFRNNINKLLREDGRAVDQVKKEVISQEVKNDIINMRKQFLAHTDMTRKNSRLEIKKLSELLESIRAEFNNVCDAINDENVKRISDMELGKNEMSYTIEMVSIYR